MNKVLTIIGARPQFVKASVVSKAIQENKKINEIILHTGQHFDVNMSEVFFNELKIPRPDIQLNIHGGTHGAMTGRMLTDIEKSILKHQPDIVLVYGDTNSTLAGALAAAKLHVPVAHIEAGLRSFNMKMPEEINRILTDQISDYLFCPTEAAVENLKKEGFQQKPVKILQPGDVMQDAAMLFSSQAKKPDSIKDSENYILATIHRAENTDDINRLREIIDALNEVHKTVSPVIIPLHPRTRSAIDSAGLELKVNIIDPVGYLEMLWLIHNCELVMTDSGGLQKESFFFRKPCVTLRDQTEWTELIDSGANKLAGANRDNILACVTKGLGTVINDPMNLYGGGEASKKIAIELEKHN